MSALQKVVEVDRLCKHPFLNFSYLYQIKKCSLP